MATQAERLDALETALQAAQAELARTRAVLVDLVALVAIDDQDQAAALVASLEG